MTLTLPLRRGADVLLVVVWTVISLAALPSLDLVRSDDAPVGSMAYVLIVVAGMATVVHRVWPAVALVGATAATGTYLAFGFPYGPVFGFVVLVVYSAARALPLTRAVPLALLAFAALCVHLLTNSAALPGVAGLLPAAAWVAIPATVGAARRSVVAANVREREAHAQRAVAAERLHIAQEVHDVVGHGLAAIQMQADIALHVAKGRPDQAGEALQAISRASSQALEDLRETLRRVHPESGTAPTAPTPGLARMEDLARRVREAGVEVDLLVEGDVQPLPQAADVAAYRVLQESLTNVVKHATHPKATVRIQHHPDSVSVEITNRADPGMVPSAPSAGLGISGMRRRVNLLGGAFEAGMGSRSGHFRVSAVIPREAQADP